MSSLKGLKKPNMKKTFFISVTSKQVCCAIRDIKGAVSNILLTSARFSHRLFFAVYTT